MRITGRKMNPDEKKLILEMEKWAREIETAKAELWSDADNARILALCEKLPERPCNPAIQMLKNGTPLHAVFSIHPSFESWAIRHVPASVWTMRGFMAIAVANPRRFNLFFSHLYGANLSRAYLSGANLSDANLSDADLSDADLSGADLSGANLSGAYLSGADLSDADLSGANLYGANLSRAYLSGADLSDADLSGAYLSGAFGISPQWLPAGWKLVNRFVERA